MNFYIGNLAFGVTEKNLKDLFIEFGEVASVKLVTDKFSGQSKGFGFLEMPSNSDADKAIKALNGNHVQGRNIKITQVEENNKSRQKKRF
jgi:RNA recognition motif-containing protein